MTEPKLLKELLDDENLIAKGKELETIKSSKWYVSCGKNRGIAVAPSATLAACTLVEGLKREGNVLLGPGIRVSSQGFSVHTNDKLFVTEFIIKKTNGEK